MPANTDESSWMALDETIEHISSCAVDQLTTSILYVSDTLQDTLFGESLSTPVLDNETEAADAIASEAVGSTPAATLAAPILGEKATMPRPLRRLHPDSGCLAGCLGQGCRGRLLHRLWECKSSSSGGSSASSAAPKKVGSAADEPSTDRGEASVTSSRLGATDLAACGLKRTPFSSDRVGCYEDTSDAWSWLGKPSKEAILAAEDSGRILKAERLLDALGDDSSVPCAGRIRSQAAFVREALRDFECVLKSAEDPETGWELWEDTGVHLRYRYDRYTGVLEVIGDIMFDIPAINLWAILREYELLPLWSRAVASNLLEQFHKDCELYHVINNPLLSVLSPTETYTERTYVDALEENGLLLVLAVSPTLEATEHRGVSIPAIPDGVKRLIVDSRDALVPISATRTIMRIQRKVDTHVPYLPTMIIGLGAGVTINGLLTNVAALDADWETSEHAKRVESGVHAKDYQSLSLRMRAMTACNGATSK